MNQSGIYFSKKDFIKNENAYVVKLSGRKMLNFNDYYKYVAKKLSFPDYFGENLDALEECLMDFSWIKEKQILIKLKNEELMLSEEDSDKKNIVDEIFQNAIDYWKEQEIEFILLKIKPR